MLKIIVTNNTGNGMSRYRLIDNEGNSIEQVNEYLDSLAVRGLSERTIRIYAYDLLNFWKWIIQTKNNLEDINRNLLLEYIRYQRQQSSPSATTINHRLIVVECLYEHCFDKRIPIRESSIEEKPVSSSQRSIYRIGWLHPFRVRRRAIRVKESQCVIVCLTHQEIAKFFNALKTWRDITMTGFMLFCGLRSREVINLKLNDIRITERQMCVLGKGNKERMIPLPDVLLMVTNKYIYLERPKNSSEHLFVVLKGAHRGNQLTSAALRTIFRYNRKISGVLKANPHKFRHGFGSEMAKAGISMPALMKLMGHTHINTTMKYINLSANDIQEEFHKTVNKLNTKDIINGTTIETK
jgi:site-specific recombinase XerD